MALWRRFGSAGFEGLIYLRKRWCSILPGGGAPSAVGVVGLRGFRALEELFPGGLPMFCYTNCRSYVALGQAKPKSEGKGGDWRKPKVENDGGIRINEAIEEREVRLVTDEGHRVVSIKEAIHLAKQLDLDLVEVQRKIKIEGGAQSPVFKPAVCKLMDYGKERYKQDVKGKERAKSKAAIALRNGENKEVRFKAKTELKDLKIKAESVKRLMERGYRVKCTAMPTGKDGEDLGGLLLNLLSQIEDISVVESGPHLDSKNAYVIVKHIKFASKKGKKLSRAVETVSSVLSNRSSAAADNNTASKDEDDCQTEEEWETVESDSETEFDGPSKQVITNAQNLSGSHPTSPPKVVSHGFSKVTDWSGFNATNDAKSEIAFNTKHTSSSGTMSASEESINKASGRNAAGFQPSQPGPNVSESNRYSKGSNSTSRQTRPSNRDHSFPPKAPNWNQRRTPEQSNRREIEGHGQSNPSDRPAHNYHPNSSSSRHAVFSASQSSDPNERSKPGVAVMGNQSAPNIPQQRFGVFISTKPSSPADEKRLREISMDRLNKSNPPTSNYGIFSSSKSSLSDDQMKQRDATRDSSIRAAPGYGDANKSSNASPPSPRFGIFTSSKKTSSGDGRVGDKN